VCRLTTLSFAKLCTNSFGKGQLNEYGAMLRLYWNGSAEVLGKIPIPLPLPPPQIPHGMC